MLFSLIHDLPEVVSGDEVTLGLSETQMAEKKLRDKLALAQLMEEYGYLLILGHYLVLYEDQNTRDAKIVYVADKSLPAVSHTRNNGLALLAVAGKYDTPDRYFGGAISATSKKIANPRYAGLPLWLSVYNEVRARAGVAAYAMDIDEARQMSNARSRESGLIVPDGWVVV
jgi:hypothetical protein